MKTTRLPGLSSWAHFQTDRGIDFCGFHWAAPAAPLLIDPMPLAPDQFAHMQERGGAKWIFVTCAEHLRAAPELAEASGAQIIALAQEKERFGEGARSVHLWVEQTSDLPAELAQAVELIGLRGGKSPVEMALYLKSISAFYFGDLIRSHVSGVLRLLPDEKLSDLQAVRASLAQLAGRAPQAILLGDGDSLYTGASAALDDLLEQKT